MAKQIHRRRVLLSKPRRRRLLLAYKGSVTPNKGPIPTPGPVNRDFVFIVKRKPAKPKKKRRYKAKSAQRLRRYVGSHLPQPVIVPDLVGDAVAAALAALSALALTSTQTTRPSHQVAAGVVISQFPLPGAKVQSGAAVALVVSTGQTSVPAVRNTLVDPALIAIAAAGLVAQVSFRPAAVAPLTVISQLPPAGTNALVGDTVFLVVATPIPVGATRAQLPSLQDIVSVTVTVN